MRASRVEAAGANRVAGDAGSPAGIDGADDHCSCVRCGDDTPTVSEIMARAYGTVMVILSIGFVIFLLMTSCMAFLHPEQAQKYLEMFAAPALALIGGFMAKAFHERMNQIKPK